MASAREPTHIGTDLGEDGSSGDGLDARNGLQQRQHFLEWSQAALDFRLDLGDRLIQCVDVRQDLPDQHQVVRLDTTLQRLAQFRKLGSESSAGQVGQDVRVLLTIQQRCEHRAAAEAEHVGRDRGELDSLMLAPSSVFCRRLASSACCWTRVLRYRVISRRMRIDSGGMKLARSRPWRSRSANHSASPGKEAALPLPPPLGTGHDGRPSSGSGLSVAPHGTRFHDG